MSLDKTDPTPNELAAILRQQRHQIELLTNEIHRNTDATQQPKWHKFVFGAAGVVMAFILQGITLIWFLSGLSHGLAQVISDTAQHDLILQRHENIFISEKDESIRHEVLQGQITKNADNIKENSVDTKAELHEIKTDIKSMLILQQDQYKLMIQKFGNGAN